mgnify:CR=1 FL=1
MLHFNEIQPLPIHPLWMNYMVSDPKRSSNITDLNLSLMINLYYCGSKEVTLVTEDYQPLAGTKV